MVLEIIIAELGVIVEPEQYLAPRVREKHKEKRKGFAFSLVLFVSD